MGHEASLHQEEKAEGLGVQQGINFTTDPRASLQTFGNDAKSNFTLEKTKTQR